MNYEVIGLIATLLVLLSYMGSKLRILRFVNIIGSIGFVVYGLLIHATSVWVLNGCCILVHIYKLYYDERPVRKSPGCIIIGYPGIGKSTLAITDSRYIDLESSLFNKPNGSKPSDWYETYCKVAIDLALHGYRVFVSSHLHVQVYLSSVEIPDIVKIYSCYPSIELEGYWLRKLHSRFVQSGSRKDAAAYVYCNKNYRKSVENMMRFDFNPIVIGNIDYKLDQLLENAIQKSL